MAIPQDPPRTEEKGQHTDPKTPFRDMRGSPTVSLGAGLCWSVFGVDGGGALWGPPARPRGFEAREATKPRIRTPNGHGMWPGTTNDTPHMFGEPGGHSGVA